MAASPVVSGPKPLVVARREVVATARLAGPVVAAQLGLMAMGFVDTVMVGRLGPDALAGIALGNTVFFTLFVVAMGTVQAVGPMVSQAHGAGDAACVTRSARQGLWLAALIAGPAMLLVWHLRPILEAVGQDPVAVAGAEGYLRAIVWGFPPALAFVALRSFVESIGRPLPVTLITLAGVAVNAAANYALMYGAFGLPALGLVGTGWASTVVYWFLFAALAALVARGRPFRRYRVFEALRTPDLATLRALVDIGWPMGVSRGVEAGLFMMTALMVGTLGATALAAHQVAIQCASFTFMLPLGISIAGAVRVGQAAGRGDADAVRRAGWTSVALATTVMTATAVLFWTQPRLLVGLYLDPAAPANADVAPLAMTLLGVAAVFQLFDGVQIAAAEALRGLKDTRVPMLVALATYWGVGLTSGYVLGLRWGYGAEGLWWGLVLGLVAAAAALLARFRRRVRRVTDAPPAS
jgi:MATE family multidrug resistance protein